MTDVFAPAELAGIRFQNRVIRSATMEDGADDKGFPTEGLTKKYLALAKGGVGGIITGFMGITAEGKAQQPGMVLLDDDAKIGPLKSLTDAVHEASVPIIAQIAHCGRNSVSGRKFDVNKMSDAELEKMITDFIAATVRTQKAGFDGVQVHFAHGYFLSEVLSPAANHRTDKWGGSEEKRFYVGERIISGIKKELPGYPIFVKIHGEDGVKNGIHADEAVRVAKRMEEAGVSAIEVSRGLSVMNSMGPVYGRVPAEMILKVYPQMMGLPGFVKKLMKPMLPKMMKTVEPAPRRYNVDAAKEIKEAVHIPVIVVGGIHDFSEIEKTINEDGIDFVSMARPLILEPGLIGKYKEGKAQKAKCIECNHCIIGISTGNLKCWYGKVPE